MTKKPNKMDTPEFGEVTKQKIGYRLREFWGERKSRQGDRRDLNASMSLTLKNSSG